MSSSRAPDSLEAILTALRAWPALEAPRVEPIGSGLLHATWAVHSGGADYVFQRVSSVFTTPIEENIERVTRHLVARGVETFQLLPTSAGTLTHEIEGSGRWRLLTRLPGTTFDVCEGPEQARSAGALVARFHTALLDFTADLLPLGFPYHDTPGHLRELTRALDANPDHRLVGPVRELAGRIFGAAGAWEDLSALPARVIHGDLKFSNVLFEVDARGAGTSRASALIDLDTLCRLPLYYDLGDAWRSWCNPLGEDVEEAELDLALLEAAAEGYLSVAADALTRAERESLWMGLERVSLELARRFATDALDERYFAWDAQRFPACGEHNLLRARGQWSLHEQARARRPEIQRSLRLDCL